MQRDQKELTLAERRLLAASSWVALAGAVACSLLSGYAFLEQARSASVALTTDLIGPAAPAASRAPVSAAPPRTLEAPPSRTVLVVGTVRAESGDPIGGAHVGSGPRDGGGVSDAAGAYEIVVGLREKQTPLLHFSAPDFEDETVALPPLAAEGLEAIHVDVKLARIGTRAVVSGLVRDALGQPIAGETVQLQLTALGASHADVTDASGAFSIPRVRVGTGYDLIVRPRGAYADHWRRGVAVAEGGTSLEVVLEPLEMQRIEGQILDVEGRPVPNFGLSIRSEGSRERIVLVQSDAQGRFAADDVPAGALHFSTVTPPRHVMRGVRASADAKDEIVIVVDSGDLQLAGRVLDDSGHPVEGAQVDLAWLHSSGALQSSSIRRSISDADGMFRFEGLGPGPHRLTASSAEQGATPGAIEVAAGANDVEVRLDRVQP